MGAHRPKDYACQSNQDNCASPVDIAFLNSYSPVINSLHRTAPRHNLPLLRALLRHPSRYLRCLHTFIFQLLRPAAIFRAHHSIINLYGHSLAGYLCLVIFLSTIRYHTSCLFYRCIALRRRLLNVRTPIEDVGHELQPNSCMCRNIFNLVLCSRGD